MNQFFPSWVSCGKQNCCIKIATCYKFIVKWYASHSSVRELQKYTEIMVCRFTLGNVDVPFKKKLAFYKSGPYEKSNEIDVNSYASIL